MLTIKEIFDICKEYDTCVDLSYFNSIYDDTNYMIKLYYGRKRNYRLLYPSELEQIFADRESFEKYICKFLEEVKEGRK